MQYPTSTWKTALVLTIEIKGRDASIVIEGADPQPDANSSF